MIRLLSTALILISAAAAPLMALDLNSMGTMRAGGVTLFDETSPFAAINNPSLLNEYGRIWHRPLTNITTNVTSLYTITSNITDFNSMAVTTNVDADGTGDIISNFTSQSNTMIVTNRTDITNIATNAAAPAYWPGRFFLANAYAGFGLADEIYSTSTEVFSILNSQAGIVLNYQGLAELVSMLTFGMIDISPLYNTNPIPQAEQILYFLTILSNSSVGAYGEVNVNIMSYLIHNVGVTLYLNMELNTGFYGNQRTLIFMLDDPALSLDAQTGLAVSIGGGKWDMPFIGMVDMGYTLRLFSAVNARFNNAEEMLSAFQTISNNTANLTTFDMNSANGVSNMNWGFGLAFDAALIKRASDNLTVTAKLSDILSPRYWLNNNSMGWVLPDLAVGLQYKIPLSDSFWFLINKPTLYFQIDDLLYTHPKSFLSKLHMGIDSRFLFDILELGLGINQGYPTAGAAVHLSLYGFGLTDTPGWQVLPYALSPLSLLHIKASIVFFGKELGMYPGDNGTVGFSSGVEVYWGF